MSDHRERACTSCGSLLHHETKCPRECWSCREGLPLVDGFHEEEVGNGDINMVRCRKDPAH